jgi:hypothetical protein
MNQFQRLIDHVREDPVAPLASGRLPVPGANDDVGEEASQKSALAERVDDRALLLDAPPVLAATPQMEIRCVRCGKEPAIGWDEQSGEPICYSCASEPPQATLN